MSDKIQAPVGRKKTPNDASEFEREQLRFLLSGEDVAATLATINPSLAWLPLLWQMQLINGESQLVAWIERNFSDPQAIHDVAANIHFFGPETARLLEYRLNSQTENLPSLLVKCWRLIIRAMKTIKIGQPENEWFEIAPQIKRGDHSADLLERLAEAFRPKLTISKRLSLYNEVPEPPESPSDFMSVSFEISDSVSVDEVLETWPKEAAAETDSKLLTQLTVALGAALSDATDAGVEGNEGYGSSDSDVPSVAQHRQNSYRSGFQVIVRLTAELWLRLARKSSPLTLSFVQQWSDSNFRLICRLAVFASADKIVPPDLAADMLIKLPRGELFLAGSSVEVYHLIRTRWKEFPKEKQQTILSRLREGPPRHWFRAGSDIDDTIDRVRFDVLSEMVRDGFDIGEDATVLLKDIGTRWPNWGLRPAEQAGFHIWHESDTTGIVGDPKPLQGVPEGSLVVEAKKSREAGGSFGRDDWRALCLSDPDRALRGLAEATAAGDWTAELWQQLLSARTEYARPDTEKRVALLLLQWPSENYIDIASAASLWLDEHTQTLDDLLLWQLWDRIADALSIEAEGEDA